MKNCLKSLGFAAVATTIVGYGSIAQSTNVTTAGTWTSVTPNGVTNLTGLNTNQISWGTPSNPSNSQSSYRFAGVTNQVLPIGTDFLLGTFTHNNFPITGTTITSANLKLNLNITPGVLNQDFNFRFNHNETPNQLPCNPTGTTICPDVVSIPNAISQETITIGGVQYSLLIKGFQQNGQVVNQFITEEGRANNAQLYGQIRRTDAIPEPLTILGAGTALGFGTLFKRQTSKKQNKKD